MKFQNGVGMNNPLVDQEGFPISNIDVYQVRHARHRIICKIAPLTACRATAMLSEGCASLRETCGSAVVGLHTCRAISYFHVNKYNIA